MNDKASWVAHAQSILDVLRAHLGSYGLSIDPTLRVAADLHPCPGYLHDARVIAFCPPVVESAVDRLRWAFFAPYMGCASLEEATRFYEVALPFVVAHELTHHLRVTSGLDAGSHFVEEQVCDRVAAALIEDVPAYAGTLAPLQERCAAMRRALAPKFGGRPTAAFVPDLAALAVDPARLAALRRITAREGLSYGALVALVPEIDAMDLQEAERAHDRARAHLDLHYTRDPAEYWYASVVWLERYLEGDERSGLIEVVNAHLSPSAATGPEWISALEAALRSEDPLIVEGAASSLVASFGGNVVDDLVDHALDSAQALAIVRALTRLSAPPKRAVIRLVRAMADRALDAPDARALLRLCALAGVDKSAAIAAARRTAPDAALAAELLAAEDREDEERIAALLDPDRTGAALEALAAHRCKLAAVDPHLLTMLPRRGTRRWQSLLTILPHRDFVPSTPRAAALRFDLGLGASPEVLERGLAIAEGAAVLAASLDGDDAGIARDALRAFSRRLALDVVTARAPSGEVTALSQVAVLLEGANEVEPVLLEIASDGDPRVRAVLSGTVVARPLDARLELSDLPPFVRAAVERASGYDPAPEVRTLLDHVIRLRAVPLFAGLTAEQLAELAPFVLERSHAVGDVIVREGDRGDVVHVVLEGEVAIRRGEQLLATLRPPSTFGEMALFDGAPRSATAIAATPCRLLSLDGDAIRRAGRRDPALYEAFLRVMSQRLREARVTGRAT